MYDLGILDILFWERTTFRVYWSFNVCIVPGLQFPHYIDAFFHNLSLTHFFSLRSISHYPGLLFFPQNFGIFLQLWPVYQRMVNILLDWGWDSTFLASGWSQGSVEVRGVREVK